jgi:hypothetical protein
MVLFPPEASVLLFSAFTPEYELDVKKGDAALRDPKNSGPDRSNVDFTKLAKLKLE